VALYYLPLYALALLSGFHALAHLSGRPWIKGAAALLPATMALALTWHFYCGFSLHHCHTWFYDAHNKEAIEILAQDREQHSPLRRVRLGNNWLLEPSLNFYRLTHHYTWLDPVTRDRLEAITITCMCSGPTSKSFRRLTTLSLLLSLRSKPSSCGSTAEAPQASVGISSRVKILRGHRFFHFPFAISHFSFFIAFRALHQ